MSLILVSAASAPPVSLTCIAQDSLAGPMSPDILLASPSSSHSVSSFQTHCQSQSHSLSKKVLDPIFIKVIRSGLIHFRGWPLASSGLCKNVRLCPSRCPTGQLPHYPPPPELFKSQNSSVMSPIETMPSGNAYIWCFNKVQVLGRREAPVPRCPMEKWSSFSTRPSQGWRGFTWPLGPRTGDLLLAPLGLLLNTLPMLWPTVVVGYDRVLEEHGHGRVMSNTMANTSMPR